MGLSTVSLSLPIVLRAAILDISRPVTEMKANVDHLRHSVQTARGYEVRLIIVCHLGDGNLHVVVATLRSTPSPEGKCGDGINHDSENANVRPESV